MTLPKTFRRIATIRTLCRYGRWVTEPDVSVVVTFTLTSEVYGGQYDYSFRRPRDSDWCDGRPYAQVEQQAFRNVLYFHGGIIISWTDPDAPAP